MLQGFAERPESAGSTRVVGLVMTVLLVGGLYSDEGRACLWDSDTIAMEKLEFPTVEDAIFGRTSRHSRELYEWRIKDRLAILERDPDNMAAMDDLVVAYDKTGRHREAVALAERSVSAHPNRYESLANYGTVLAHAGDLKNALVYLNRAVAINPDAHFGRERIQIYLVEIVVERMRATCRTRPPLPLGGREGEFSISAAFARRISGGDTEHMTFEQRREVVAGLVGMLQFGQHDSPILLEALSDVLVTRPDGYAVEGTGDGVHTRLAYYAMVRAAESAVGAGRYAYSVRREYAAETLTSEEYLLPYYRKKLAEAERWVERRHAAERQAIRDGKNPDELSEWFQ